VFLVLCVEDGTAYSSISLLYRIEAACPGSGRIIPATSNVASNNSIGSIRISRSILQHYKNFILWRDADAVPHPNVLENAYLI
jgi:hypothetical protein